MKTYQYIILSIRDYPMSGKTSSNGVGDSSMLNEFGKQGWKLHKVIDKESAIMEKETIENNTES